MCTFIGALQTVLLCGAAVGRSCLVRALHASAVHALCVWRGGCLGPLPLHFSRARASHDIPCRSVPPRSRAAMTTRTTAPMVTGGSVVAVKYAGGILVATDTNGSYGSLVKFDGIPRMSAVGMAGDTILAAGGDYGDYQQLLKMIDVRATEEYAIDDGASMAPAQLLNWLSRVMYQRRSKMDPLWNRYGPGAALRMVACWD